MDFQISRFDSKFHPNLGGIPGANNELGFAIFALGLATIGGLVAWLFLRSRWL